LHAFGLQEIGDKPNAGERASMGAEESHRTRSRLRAVRPAFQYESDAEAVRFQLVMSTKALLNFVHL